jgi:3-hydroxyethyl bacteriochlorophyllide a dehydrogenase
VNAAESSAETAPAALPAVLPAATPAAEPPRSTAAVVLDAPGRLAVRTLSLTPPGPEDVVVALHWSGVSSGTERLLYRGTMPAFPGLSYPLVPGYESVGEVVWRGAAAAARLGERVFVPGARCFEEAAGLFGGAAALLAVPAARVVPVPASLGRDASLLALAATARHALTMAGGGDVLIVGHGALGRLLARLALLPGSGTAPPTVWETAASRRDGARGYRVLDPADDPRRDYASIIDVSGDATVLDDLVGRLAPGGQIVLAGFYDQRPAFDFAPAFIREVTLRIAAQWAPEDLAAVARLAAAGELDLGGLITHRAPAEDAARAYRQAFDDPDCLKMILDWRQP